MSGFFAEKFITELDSFFAREDIKGAGEYLRRKYAETDEAGVSHSGTADAVSDESLLQGCHFRICMAGAVYRGDENARCSHQQPAQETEAGQR